MSERKHPPQPGNSRERWVTAALDAGVAIGCTPEAAARRTEDLFTELGLPGRRLLANSLRDHGWQQFQRALALDKKGLYTFVVLREIGEAETAEVPEAVVKSLFGGWRGR